MSGATPKTGVAGYWGRDIEWVTPNDLSKDRSQTIAGGERQLTYAGYDSCSARLFPAGSVVVSSRAPIGYVAIAGTEMCTNQGCKTAIPPSYIDSRYLYWYMLNAKADMEARASGTTFKEISSKRFGETLLIWPVLDEQRGIVDILEDHLSRLDAADRGLEMALTRAAVKERSMIDGVFMRRADNEQWPVVRLEQLAARERRAMTDGPFGSNLTSAHYTDSGARVVRLQNIGDGEFRSADAFISLDHYETLRVHEVLAGDVVVASLGELLPRAAIVPDLGGPAIVKADCIRIRLQEDIEPAWIVLACRSSGTKRWAEGQVHGAGRQRLGMKGIRDIPIPVPAESIRMAAIAEMETGLESLARLRVAISSVKSRGVTLKRSLLEAAFSARLTGRSSDMDRVEEMASV